MQARFTFWMCEAPACQSQSTAFKQSYVGCRKQGLVQAAWYYYVWAPGGQLSSPFWPELASVGVRHHSDLNQAAWQFFCLLCLTEPWLPSNTLQSMYEFENTTRAGLIQLASIRQPNVSFMLASWHSEDPAFWIPMSAPADIIRRLMKSTESRYLSNSRENRTHTCFLVVGWLGHGREPMRAGSQFPKYRAGITRPLLPGLRGQCCLTVRPKSRASRHDRF